MKNIVAQFIGQAGLINQATTRIWVKEVTLMPTCGECKLLVPNPKGEGYRCLGRRCGATKVTPDKDASRCTKFDKK